MSEPIILADETIAKLAEALAGAIKAPVSLDVALWNVRSLAAHLDVSTRQVLERYAVLPDFPKAIRLTSTRGEGGNHPLWKAREVIEWAEKQQRKSVKLKIPIPRFHQ